MHKMEKTVLDFGREIEAIAKNGIAFSKDPFDLERFHQLETVAAELISRHSDHSKVHLGSIFSAEKGYSTPKLDVRGAVFRDGRVLMVKEKSGGWTLPGGYVDVNESLSQAIEREVNEESGLLVKAQKIAAIFDHRQHGYKPHLYHFYKIYIICTLNGGFEKTNIETTDIAWFSKSELESVVLDQGRITKTHVLRMFDHLTSQLLPTDFD